MGDVGVIAFCTPLEACHGGKIQSIDLEYKNIGSKGIEAIGRAFRSSMSLIELRLSRNPSIGDNCIVSFNQGEDMFQSLKLLDLSACSIGSIGMEKLTEALLQRTTHSRMSLKLDENLLGAASCNSLRRLISSSQLSSLSIKGCSIGDDGLQILKSPIHMKHCRGLNTLNLGDNGIGPMGAQYLAKLLAETDLMMDINDLDLSRNPLGSDGVTFIISALQQSTAREPLRLDLTSTGCGIEGALSALNCRNIRSLILFNNALGSDGFTALASMLKGGHPELEYLDLGGNMAEADAVNNILIALGHKNSTVVSTLKTIILGGNATNEAIEKKVNELILIRPELDVAFDLSDRVRDD